MSRVFLLNIGANTQHRNEARSPLLPDGSFVYVPFPTAQENPPPGYSDEALRFTNGVSRLATHADPDWTNLTYGDYCRNPRAIALLTVKRDDVLLFWGLLWNNSGGGWSGFDGRYGWYLIGALVIDEVVTDQTPLDAVPEACRSRVAINAHFAGRNQLEMDHRVFVGRQGSSGLFSRAVDLQVPRADGLIYRTIRAAGGQPLALNGRPRWNSSLRSCRCAFDLSNATDAQRFDILRRTVHDQTDFRFAIGD